jgi:hypothetical protein
VVSRARGAHNPRLQGRRRHPEAQREQQARVLRPVARRPRPPRSSRAAPGTRHPASSASSNGCVAVLRVPCRAQCPPAVVTQRLRTEHDLARAPSPMSRRASASRRLRSRPPCCWR